MKILGDGRSSRIGRNDAYTNVGDTIFPSKLWRNENVFSLRPYGTRPPPESTHPAAAHEETLQRELSSFESVRDNYPKTLLTLDDAREQSYDGIRRIYALDWLLGKVEA